MLITGAGRGLGRAIAVRLAGDGMSIICAGRDREALQTTAELITAAGGAAQVIELDLRDRTALAELPGACGTLDAAVANSGVAGPTGPAWTIGAEEWDETLQVNLTGGFLLARAVLPGMIQRGAGSVVFIGSTTAGRPLPGRAAYAASKSALSGLVRSLALDAGPHGVRINLVSPGPIAGDRLESVLALQARERGTTVEDLRSEFLSASPMRRLTEPGDVAAAVAFLIGPGAQGITGAELTVASGTVMA